MKQKTKLESVAVGVTGEYYVAGELSHRGYISSITLRNTRGIDIIVSNKEGTKSATIQVKSTQNNMKNSWILTQKSEDFFSENHFYIFVNLDEPGIRPKFFVVPSEVVAQYISTSHKNWLNKPGRNGQQHNDNQMRRFDDLEGQYLEAWSLIENHLK
ncbi:MAG: aspartate ammonia-lyase [Leptospira sp.]|nr:aspartate ammonia-lyase [Leptospira sp.]